MKSRTFRSPTMLLFLGLVSAVLLSAPPASAQSAEEVVSAVKSRLKQANAISADFDQTFSSAYIDQTETTSGTILLKGDMYRVETPSQTFVTDGHITWIYNRADNQVLINNYSVDETTFSLNRFLFDFDDRYYPSAMDAGSRDAGTYRVTLRSLDPAAFFPEVTMTVRKNDHEISRLEVVDANETLITINLRNVTFDPPLTRDSFTFVPPDSSEIVDLRS